TTGRPAYWEHVGDLIEPLIASMSLPGIFPPVELDGRPHVDGAITSNLPVDQATENGAQTTVAILCTCCPPPLTAPEACTGCAEAQFHGRARLQIRPRSRALPPPGCSDPHRAASFSCRCRIARLPLHAGVDRGGLPA
ncbi:Patatin domain protein, partial [mine drainage metagenome]